MHIQWLYCNEKDENKLLKNTFKNRIICKNCYDIIIEMTKLIEIIIVIIIIKLVKLL